jgi:hypothetical protein
MIHQHALVKPQMEAMYAEIRHDRVVRGMKSESSGPGSIRSALGRILVLAGAKIHGSAPAVIGSRVVLLDQHGDEEFQPAI